MLNINIDSPQRTLRHAAARARATLSHAHRRIASEAIAHRVLQIEWIRRGVRIGCYLSVGHEVDTWPLIDAIWARNKRVFLPIVGPQSTRRMRFLPFTPWSGLRRNALGIHEPHPARGHPIKAQHLDAVVVPLVAFDSQCHRIGMGGGYFDTTFAFLRQASLWRKPRLIGIAFDCQRVETISPNRWDLPLDAVITENHLYRRAARA